ncbi:hypothetical protein JHJ32_09705 [Parapedobacter sp. ISTM3]|uniref:Uncharacterized protein n=2 Tax=Parapedobacter TaxID=416949 RepID=A0A1T5AUP1_9SPHI|nr:hypothetical protein [Parapedobacter luteus]MBK1440259.1 hypothetical protein [Parapedobacter sp. ISTM3]SKB38686.1 hypothetical protein SAMN05660226_01076 [Parapedobacter luteus]
MTDFVKGSISIGADVTIIQQVLIQYKYIKEWEKGFDSFKELHVSDGLKSIVHWDIEHDIDYVFSLAENKNGVSLEIMVGDLTRRHGEKYKLDEIKYYVDTVLCRIKGLSESLHIDLRHRSEAR